MLPGVENSARFGQWGHRLPKLCVSSLDFEFIREYEEYENKQSTP